MRQIADGLKGLLQAQAEHFIEHQRKHDGGREHGCQLEQADDDGVAKHAKEAGPFAAPDSPGNGEVLERQHDAADGDVLDDDETHDGGQDDQVVGPVFVHVAQQTARFGGRRGDGSRHGCGSHRAPSRPLRAPPAALPARRRGWVTGDAASRDGATGDRVTAPALTPACGSCRGRHPAGGIAAGPAVRPAGGRARPRSRRGALGQHAGACSRWHRIRR